MIDSGEELGGGGVFHKREAEPFFAKVLDGGSDEIDFVINDQKAVVSLGECLDIYGRILTVVPGNVQT